MKQRYALAFLLLLLTPILVMPALAINNVDAMFVTNVRDIQDYDVHWNDRYPPNSTLRLYVESQDISHNRITTLDYLFMITDPEGIFIDGSFIGKRYFLFPGKTNYTTNDYVIYSKNIPDEWLDGAYTVDIYVFDLTNDSKTSNAFAVVKNNFINSGFAFVEKNASETITTTYEAGTTYGPITTESIQWYPYEWDSDLADLILINRTNADFVHVVRHFFVDRHSSKYPPDWFHLEDLELEVKEVASNELINASLNATNTYFEGGTTNFSVQIDNFTFQNFSIMLNASETKTINFTLSNETLGLHTVKIIPTLPRTLGINVEQEFTVTRKEIATPPTMVVKDLQIDDLKATAGEQINITLIVENTGRNGSAPVSIKVNNELFTETATANITETVDVVFNITLENEGDYRVEVPGTRLAKLFFVEKATPLETPATVSEELGEKVEEKKPQLRLILLIATIVVVLYILRTYLRFKNR